MTSPTDIYFLFFALPGFLTLLAVRHIALYKRTLTQTEFVFYSLACSIPSYLTAVLIIEAAGTAPRLASEPRADALAIVIQTAFAALYGCIVGIAIRKVWRSQQNRHTPWHNFMARGQSHLVVVHTTSSRRYYGWLKQASSDDEAQKEIVLGDPVRLDKDGSKIDIGLEIVFSEGEIARVVRVRYSDDVDVQPSG